MHWKTVVTHWKAILIFLLIIWVAAAGKIADHYHDKYKKASEALGLANATITDMTTRQRDVAALDAKYTQELADAKSHLDDLQRCVRDGKCGLHVNARCPASGAASTGGMGDATGPRLTDSAERDYFTLRDRIVTITGQVNYLQEYINAQCLN